MTLVSIVFPRTKNKHTPGGNSIKNAIGRFVIITETIVSQEDKVMLLCK